MCYSAANIDTQVYPRQSNSWDIEHLIKVPLEYMTDFLTYRSCRYLKIALERLEKGIMKTQALGSS